MEIGKYFSEHPNEDRVVINPDDPESWLYYGSTDWMDEVYESSAPSYTVNFNISQKAKRLLITYQANMHARMVCYVMEMIFMIVTIFAVKLISDNKLVELK